MMVLIDTTIWSLALRRRADKLSTVERALVAEWAELVAAGRAVLMALIRQEVLSGIRDERTFLAIQERLSDFAYLEILAEDYDCAARFFNACRTRGIAATHVDMLICSVAHRHDVPIFTTDGDFPDYAKCVPIRLYSVAKQG